MKTKLTLRLDQKLVRRAKTYAKRTGKSVSQIVAEYFLLLGSRAEDGEVRLTPTVKSLKGALRGGQVDKADYRRYLEEKYL